MSAPSKLLATAARETQFTLRLLTSSIIHLIFVQFYYTFIFYVFIFYSYPRLNCYKPHDKVPATKTKTFIRVINTLCSGGKELEIWHLYFFHCIFSYLVSHSFHSLDRDLQPPLLLADDLDGGGGLGLIERGHGDARLGQGSLGEDRSADGTGAPLGAHSWISKKEEERNRCYSESVCCRAGRQGSDKKRRDANRETASTPAATTYLPPAARTVPDGRQPQPGRERGPEVRREQKLHKGSGTRAKETSKELQLGSDGEAKSDVKPQGKVKTKPQTTPSIRRRARHDTWVSPEKRGSERSVTRVSRPAKKATGRLVNRIPDSPLATSSRTNQSSVMRERASGGLSSSMRLANCGLALAMYLD